jgi:hypothetical protein
VIQPPHKSSWDKNSFLKYINPNTFSFATKVQNIHQLFQKGNTAQRVDQNLGYLPGMLTPLA